MKTEFIPKFVMLLAGAVVSVITIIKDMDVTYSLELLLATLIIFYIIGIIAKKIVQKVLEGNMFVKQEEEVKDNVTIPENKEETEETDESETDTTDEGMTE